MKPCPSELDAVAVMARFEDKLYLAEVLARRFVKSNPKLDAAEFAQEGRVALWNAAQNFNPSLGVEFGAYATRCVKCSFLTHLKKLRGPKNTNSLDHPFATSDDGEDVTWETVFDKKTAHRELCNRPGDDRTAALILTLVDLLKKSPDLTKLQRKIMKLHFLGGLSQVEIARKLGVSRSSICGHLKQAVRRLRAAVRKRAFEMIGRAGED